MPQQKKQKAICPNPVRTRQGIQEWEISAILQHRKTTNPDWPRNGDTFYRRKNSRAGFREGWDYLVSWKGWGDNFNEWVYEKDLFAEDMKEEYWRQSGQNRWINLRRPTV
ncbi:hypothetical protein C8J55DRAFT_566293 [Lentinula edodes]|uniref:Chromo domain-containing protein n=1 Tax=Lentinula lateritia TaxID=40482 RepID=A0A9W9DDR4_9AGAR|nr:hypothetical protein C8J55DRAFT_566293 [Lentinula edodes]